jgi:hypothetical protein
MNASSVVPSVWSTAGERRRFLIGSPGSVGGRPPGVPEIP